MTLPLPVGRTAAVLPDVRRIALLRATALGDLVVALPAVEALRAAYPAAEITWLGTPLHVELLADRPGPWDRVEVSPSLDAPLPADWLAGQRSRAYDLALQLHGGGRNSNPLVTGLGARTTAGAQDVDAPPLDRVVPYDRTQPELLRLLELVGLVGASPVGLEPRLAVPVADRDAAARALPDDGLPLVALHAGSTDVRRCWPVDRFAAVARALADTGARVVTVGSAGDPLVPGTDDLRGRLRLPALTGLLARCELVAGNDSGPRHLAMAVGTPTVGVFTVDNLGTYGPLVRTRHRVAVSTRTACPVCGLPWAQGRCAHDASFVGDVPVEAVLGPALDLLGASDRRTAAA